MSISAIDASRHAGCMRCAVNGAQTEPAEGIAAVGGHVCQKMGV